MMKIIGFGFKSWKKIVFSLMMFFVTQNYNVYSGGIDLNELNQKTQNQIFEFLDPVSLSQLVSTENGLKQAIESRYEIKPITFQSLNDLPQVSNGTNEENIRYYLQVKISSEFDDEDELLLCLKNPALSKVSRLDLSQVYCFSPKHLVEALGGLKALNYLDLSHRGMTADEVNELVPFLSSNQNIMQLNLQCNELKNEGLCKMAKVLLKNKTLSDLNVSANTSTYDDSSDDAAKAFAEALKVNVSLKKLDLRTNQLTDEGAFAFLDNDIAAAFRPNERHVDLSRNSAILPEAILVIRSVNPKLKVSFEELDENTEN